LRRGAPEVFCLDDAAVVIGTPPDRAFGFEATGEWNPARSDPSLEIEGIEASLVAASGDVGKR
jgi:hypothetical protein